MLLAFIADIHEDIQQLRKAIEKIQALKCDVVACLGDIVGFSIPYYKYLHERNAFECIKLITQHCQYVVAGNHDHYAVRHLPRHNPYPDIPENWYNLCYHQRYNINQNRIWLYEENELPALLCHTQQEWIMQLPEFQILDAEPFRIFISHFIYPDLTGLSVSHLAMISEYQQHMRFMELHCANICFFGHVHSKKILLTKKDGTVSTERKIKLTQEVSGIGVPALTRSAYSGFVTFNTEKRIIQFHKI